MTVYFVEQSENPDLVKIGFSTNLDSRLANIASEVGPINLVAQSAGGRKYERTLHEVLKADRLEGEWFKRSPQLEAILKSHAVPRKNYAAKARGWKKISGETAVGRDLINVGRIIDVILSQRSAAVTRKRHLEEIFHLLHALNPAWSRRRVRALHQGDARQVCLFEAIGLLRISGIERLEWVEYLAPELMERDR